MAYSADTFVADEQPTTAKWNKLWTNDASFNDGTGIATGAITSAKISGIDKSLTTTDSNPYKFRARRVAALAVTVSTQTSIAPDTEDYDTNSNFASGTYTAPLAAFYHFGMYCNIPGGTNIQTLYKNGSAYQRGTQSGSGGVLSSFQVQSAASDTWQSYIFVTSGASADVTATLQPFFEGYLFCRT